MADENPSIEMFIVGAMHAKRAGVDTSQSMDRIVRACVDGSVATSLIAAWLATLASCGMSEDETLALMLSYVDTGEVIDLREEFPAIVDKHSTGGVGDKVTIALLPVVAACGIPMAKISGRGLGIDGGTIDKLESVPGLKLALDRAAIEESLKLCGMAIVSQTESLVPGDAATYAVRDLTGSAESIPLIAASIVAKKVALRTRGFLLDVKVGDGCLISSFEEAERLTRLVQAIAARCELHVKPYASDMTQPLGHAVGNALEVREALSFLHGEAVPGLSEVVREFAASLIRMGNPAMSDQDACRAVEEAIQKGTALDTMRTWLQAQGADPAVVDNPGLLVPHPESGQVMSPENGWVKGVDSKVVGTIACQAGAGRLREGDQIDATAGILIRRRVGDEVIRGEPLATVYGKNAQALARQLAKAFTISQARVAGAPPFLPLG